MKIRKIIHVDMDAFYASVEQRENPHLRGRPVVVGGDPQSRAVVCSASYEARKFGVRSAMPCSKAARLCPSAVFVPPRISYYAEVSTGIRAIFESVSRLVEPLSLDEAYIDVTENTLGEAKAGKVAAYVLGRIADELKLSASAGVGPSKFVAKTASDLRKPGGLVVIPPTAVEEFVANLPVEKFWGVGKVTQEKLLRLGWKTGRDLRDAGRSRLVAALGRFGSFLYDLSIGIDEREVEPDQAPKSRASEVTFDRDVVEPGTLEATLIDQAGDIARGLRDEDLPCRTVTIKVRYADFKTITRSLSFTEPTESADMIAEAATLLLRDRTELGSQPVRLIGLSVSGFAPPDEARQLSFNFNKFC